MRRIWTVLVIGLVLTTCMAFPAMGSDDDLHLAFFTPEGEENIFWGQVLHFMRQAAEALEIRLTIYDAEGNHVKMVRQVKEAINGDDPPDAIIIINFKQYAAKVLEFTEHTQVPTFIINTSFQESENMGKPREKYQYWIGEMIPDDEQAGYLLAQKLLEEARRHHDRELEMVGISGNPFGIVQASDERVRGLQRAVKEDEHVTLHQIVVGSWSQEQAASMTKDSKRRYPETTIIWTASDGMGLGVVESAKELGLQPNKDLFTGGVDWSLEGLESVEKGEMTATIGGHIMEGAWAVVLLYDYLHGQDFASEAIQMRTPMRAVTASNVETVLPKLRATMRHAAPSDAGETEVAEAADEQQESLDFRSFSKVLNPELSRYNFDMAELFSENPF